MSMRVMRPDESAVVVAIASETKLADERRDVATLLY